MKHFLRLTLLLAAMGCAPLITMAQDGGGESVGMTKKQQEKHLAKKERADRKSLAKEEKRLHKKHLENQDKSARKRMKRNQKRAEKHGQGTHRDPFFRRLFGSRH